MPEPTVDDVHVNVPLGVMRRRKRSVVPLPPTVTVYLNKLKELLKGTVSSSVFDDAVKRARGHAGGRATAMRRYAAEDDPPTGIMVAYFLKPDEAAALAMAGGQPPAELHLTLAYLGDVGDVPADVAERATAALSALSYALGPVPIEATGVDRFEAEDSGSSKDVIYATVDDCDNDDDGGGMNLCGLHDRVCGALCAVGLVPRNDYGEWEPHITLSYVDPDTEVTVKLPDVDMVLDTLTLAVGGKRTNFALTGNPGSGDTSVVAPGMMSEPLRMGEFIEPPATIPVLPRPGVYSHPTYGTVDMSSERIDSFMSTFKAGAYQTKIPVDLEHQTQMSGAAGWITGLVKNSDGSVDANVEWTDMGTEALRRDRFAYVSPTWYDEWTAPIDGHIHKNVLIGAALTTRPFFKAPALRALAASEAIDMADYTAAQRDAMSKSGKAMPDGAYPIANRADLANAIRAVGRGGADHDTIRKHIMAQAKSLGLTSMIPDNWAADGSMKASEEDPMVVDPKTITMNEAQAKQFAEMQAELTELKTAKTAAEALATSQGEALKTATEQIGSMRDAAETKRFTEEVMGQSPASDLRWFGEPEKHVTVMKHIAKTAGEDSDIFKAYVSQQRALAEQMRSSKLFNEIGSSRSGDSAASPWGRIEAEARKVASEEKVTFERAVTLVSERRPDLYAEYRADEARLAREG